jgi:pseudouridine kinase
MEEPAANECKHVLVIGAANLDIKGRPEGALAQGTSVPGHIRSSLGGVARNIAENLARLEVETVLLTAVGDDDTGERILGHAAGSGIDISEALVLEGQRSGAYMALLSTTGTLDIALDDMSIISAITPDYLESCRRLFEEACLVCVDSNLTPEALAKVVALCDEYDVALCADPASVALASRLIPHLSHLYFVTPNVQEASVLCGCEIDPADRSAVQAAAAQLVSLGVDMCVITLGESGVVYADSETIGHIPAIQTQVVDPTGAGDAMSAAIIFGLLEDMPLDECVRLGVTAASLTLRSKETVRSDLTVDLLYNELVA